MSKQTPQRKLPACERCRTRKTKCDSQLPSCSNCLKAGEQCMNRDKILGRSVARSYVWLLQEQGMLYEHQDTPQQGQGPSKRRQIDTSAHFTSGSSPDASDSDGSEHLDVGGPVQNTMDTLLALSLTGGPNTTVSDDLDLQIRLYSVPGGRSAKEMFIERENMAIAKLGKDFLKVGRKNYTRNRTADVLAYDISMLRRLTRRYLTWMNSAFPVMHECLVRLQLERCCAGDGSALAVDVFQLKMMIAIALASISRPHVSTSEIGRIAHVFWKSANRSQSAILLGTGVNRLQNILLLLQYTLLVPRAGNLWQLCGTAMRFVTEMGVYSEPSPSQAFDPLTLDLRRRLFWTCYCIDRMLSTVMRRPTGIADSWITAKVPALVEDRNITVKAVIPGPLCHLKFAQIQQIRVCRLQSEIHRRLYALGHQSELSTQQMAVWSWQMYDQLRLWRATFTHATPMITKEWTELQFHISVVLLFRPSPNRPKLSNEALHVAFHSAGEVMKLVKVMHRDCSAVFSWITVQNLFMCGLTFVNSLKEFAEEHNPHHLCLSFYEIFLQIQSCTTMLETLSALEAGANEKVRNAFEMISSGVLQTIAGISHTLPLQSNYTGCMWAQIAKSDSISIQRPTQVEGLTIPVLTSSPVLEDTNIYAPESGARSHDDTHFYAHDIDASSAPETPELPDSSIYDTKEKKPMGPDSARTHPDTIRSTVDTSKAGDFGLSRDHGTPDGIHSLASVEDPRLDRLAAFSQVASEAEPIRGSETPMWTETSLGAELDRWFLYPFPDNNDLFAL